MLKPTAICMLGALALLGTALGQDPLQHCSSLQFYSSSPSFNDQYLSSCSVLPEDMPDCLRLTCTNTVNNVNRPIASFVVTFIPCGEGGMKLAVRLTATDFDGNNLLDRTFFDSMRDVAVGTQGYFINVQISRQALGITFAATLRLGGGIPLNFLRTSTVILDSTEYACPSIPGLQQPTATCSALGNLQRNTDILRIDCTTNQACLSVRCTDRVPIRSSTEAARVNSVNYYGINLLPCSSPPAVQIVLASNIIGQLNVTVSQTTSNIQFSNLGTFTITMDLSSDQSSFNFMMEYFPADPADPTEVYFPQQTIPISPASCQSVRPATNPPATNPPATTPPFTTRQLDTANIRLAGGSSPNRGRLEVLVNGAWGTVCNDFTFSFTEANVACQQLQGFGQASDYGTYTTYSSNLTGALPNLPTVMENVRCSSSNRRLQDCIFNNPNTCTGSSVGVECSNCSLYLCSDGQCVNGALCNGVTDCIDASDENDIICAIVSGLSNAIKIAIAVGVIILVLIIVIPVSICVCVCCCTGACIAKSANSYGPRNTSVVATGYNPAPGKMQPVV